MKLVVFLGNAGLEYSKNRHNLGFMIGDFYAKQQGIKWKFASKFAADLSTFQPFQVKGAGQVQDSLKNEGEKVILVKPQLFYNRTGEVVAKIAGFYKIDEQDILAVCDDFNLDFGKIRYRKKGSDGGNNGLKSLVAQFGEKFARVRIGTGSKLRQQIGETDFVLSNFTKDEVEKLPEIYEKVIEIVDDFIKSA